MLPRCALTCCKPLYSFLSLFNFCFYFAECSIHHTHSRTSGTQQNSLQPCAHYQIRHSWMYPLVPTRYYLEGVVTNVLVGVEITCNDADVAHFLPPPNVTCGDYAANFLVNSTGYITNPNATQPELCGYCQYERGEDYYESFIGYVQVSEVFFFFSILSRAQFC